jgi:4-amino-4-deoxy-L-arabinose transferase-like glycosyltransferase
MNIAQPSKSSQPPTASRLGQCLAALALALAAAGYAQSLADQRLTPLRALAVYVGAALLYVLSTRPRPSPALSSAPPQLALCIDWRLLGWALVFAALAFASLGDNRFTLQGVLPWLLAMALSVWALRAQPAPPRTDSAARAGWLRVSWGNLALLGAMLAGAWLRFYRLAELPADLGWDLPYNYADVQSILRGEPQVFFPANMGREGLFFYLAAGVARIVGLSPYSLRLTSALVGVAAIPAVYLLARTCADRETGLYAVWLLAFSKWHVMLSRSGYRVSLMPLLATLALYGLARGLRRGSARDWAWCGLCTGLGLWSYKAFVFVLPVIAACAALYALLDLRRRPTDTRQCAWSHSMRQRLLGIALWLLVTIITATPLLRYVVDAPDAYLTRELHAQKLVSSSAVEQSRWAMLGENALTSLWMFNYVGDGNSRFGVPFQRHLGFLGGILFVFGVAGALATPRRDGYALLLVALLGLLAPMTVSMVAHEMPNCFRSSGTLGPVAVLAALALRRIRGLLTAGAERWSARPARLLGLLAPLAVLFALLGEGRETERFYFVDYFKLAPDRSNYSIALEISRTITSFEGSSFNVVVWPHWFDGRALSVHLDTAGRAPANELLGLAADQPPIVGVAGPVLCVLHPDDSASFELLRDSFARYTAITHTFPDGTPAFIAFYGAH